MKNDNSINVLSLSIFLYNNKIPFISVGKSLFVNDNYTSEEIVLKHFSSWNSSL